MPRPYVRDLMGHRVLSRSDGFARGIVGWATGRGDRRAPRIPIHHPPLRQTPRKYLTPSIRPGSGPGSERRFPFASGGGRRRAASLEFCVWSVEVWGLRQHDLAILTGAGPT